MTAQYFKVLWLWSPELRCTFEVQWNTVLWLAEIQNKESLNSGLQSWPLGRKRSYSFLDPNIVYCQVSGSRLDVTAFNFSCRYKISDFGRFQILAGFRFWIFDFHSTTIIVNTYYVFMKTCQLGSPLILWTLQVRYRTL